MLYRCDSIYGIYQLFYLMLSILDTRLRNSVVNSVLPLSNEIYPEIKDNEYQ